MYSSVLDIYFKDMLQVLYINVVKVDRNIAHVA
jgi:hypothetical protein